MSNLDLDLLDSYFDLCLNDPDEDDSRALCIAIDEAANLYAERIVGDLARPALYDLLASADEAELGEALHEVMTASDDATLDSGLDLALVAYMVLWARAYSTLTHRVETVRGVL